MTRRRAQTSECLQLAHRAEDVVERFDHVSSWPPLLFVPLFPFDFLVGLAKARLLRLIQAAAKPGFCGSKVKALPTCCDRDKTARASARPVPRNPGSDCQARACMLRLASNASHQDFASHNFVPYRSRIVPACRASGL